MSFFPGFVCRAPRQPGQKARRKKTALEARTILRREQRARSEVNFCSYRFYSYDLMRLTWYRDLAMDNSLSTNDDEWSKSMLAFGAFGPQDSGMLFSPHSDLSELSDIDPAFGW